MNGEQLYKQLKLGQINKSQLTDKEIGEVYKYMVDRKKVSTNELKPAVTERYNLSESNKMPVRQEPLKISDYSKPTSNVNYNVARDIGFDMSRMPKPDFGYTPTPYNQNKSTNPEMELVDLLSNLSMPQRGRTIPNERSQAESVVKKSLQNNNDINLGDRIGYGLKSIGQNWLGGMLGASATGGEFLGTGDEVIIGEGKTNKGFDLSYKLMPSSEELMQQSDELLQEAQRNTQLGKQGLGKVGGTVYDILQGAGQMGADIGTAVATGTGILPIIGTRTFGQSSSEARQQGATIGEQVGYGALSAGIEIATEKIVGGLPLANKLGMGGVADNTIKKLSQGIASSPRLVKALTYIGNMAGEGAEEAISEVLTPVAQRLTYDPDADWATLEETLYSALLGAGISGVMGGGVLFQGEQQETTQPQETVQPQLNDIPDIEGFQTTMQTGLDQLYTALESNPDVEQIDKMIESLNKTKELVPALNTFADENIQRLNSFKSTSDTFTEQPNRNENETVDTLFNNEEKIELSPLEQSHSENIENQIQVDDNVLETETQDNILQESNNIVTETQQNDEANPQPLEVNAETTNIKEHINGNDITEGDIMKNVGYHAGDLGKADYLNIMPGRGTGHFGTGTYFVGNEKDIDIGDYKDRPRHTVSFEGYNLYKPKTTEEGRKLHKFLKNINDLSFLSGYEDVIDDILNGKVDDEYIDNLISTKFPYNSDFDFNIDYSDIDDTNDIEKMLSQIEKKISQTNIPPEVEERKRNIEQYQNFLNKLINNIEDVKQELKNKFNFSDDKINSTIKELYDYGTSNLNSKKMDSPSTVFMKSLGYEGVDVRGLKGLDDTEFGSVIYDLKENGLQDTDITPQPQEQNETLTNEQTVNEDNDDTDTLAEQQEDVVESETVEAENTQTETEVAETVDAEIKTTPETKEQQIEETKEELEERVEDKQEIKLNQSETKILNALNSNLNDLLSSTYDGEYFVNNTVFDEYFEMPKNKKDGFDDYQRVSFVKDLISGLKSDKESIHVDIPNDGTFDIVNSLENVSVIINRLGVRAKTNIAKNLNKIINNKTNSIIVGNDYYSDDVIIVKTNTDTIEHIKDTYKDKVKVKENALEEVLPSLKNTDGWTSLNVNPVKTREQLSNGIKAGTYIFKVDEKYYGYNAKLFDVLNTNGNKFYILDSRHAALLKIEDANGNIVGALAPVNMTGFEKESYSLTDGNLFEQVKQNFYSKPRKTKTKASVGEQAFTGNTQPNATLIDKSRHLKKPSEIRKFITKTFNVPTTSKKFRRSKKVLGYYKVMPEVIRLRYDNEIGTVMHELGHHLDKKYDFSSIDKKLINDMVNKMNPAFKKNYQKNELPGEAIAEFLRYYTTDPVTADQFAGDFYDLFEQTLSKDDLKNIHAIRSDVLRWVNAERKEKRMSTIVPISKKKKVSERISEAINFEKYNMILFDRFAPLKRFADTVEKLTGKKLDESLNPHLLVERTYKNEAIIEGIVRGQLRDVTGKEIDTDDNLQKIIDSVENNMTEFEDYLKLKHAITLEQKGHQIYNRDIYSSVEEMQQDLLDIEQENPEFVKASERLYDWYDKFFKAWVVDTNMLGKDSKKAYQTMREEYPYYVPMFRVREDNSTKRAKNSLTDQKSPIDKLSEKGNDQDTISPIDNIITQVSRMVNAYSKNNVMRAIVENYNTVDGLGGFIDRVPPDMEKQILSTQSIKDMIDYDFKKKDNAELIDNIINAIPDMIENYKSLTQSKDKEIVGVIAEDGTRQFYQVFDKQFLDSLTNMNPIQLDFTVRMIASIRRTTTGLTTGLNPIFSFASNAPRDFTQAYIYGSYKNPAEYVYEYLKSLLVEVPFKSKRYKMFKELGGVYGSSMTSELRTRNDFIRHLEKYRKGKGSPKNALSYIAELVLDFNDAIETAPRLTEFKKAYSQAQKQGKSEQDSLLYALSKSDDVTLNFSRRGTIMNTAAGQAIPYLNAGLQGIDKLRRGLFTGEEKTQTLIKSLTMLTIPTILLWAFHRDDEDYEKLSKGIKDNYWVLWKNDDGSFVRIPKPKDLSAIFSSDFERALNSYFKDDDSAFEGFKTTLADSLLPPIDTIFRPLIDVASNKKWSGGKIVPTALEYETKTAQYDETTSKIGIVLAQAIGKVFPGSDYSSPKNMDYILDQYYGGLADILLPMTTPNSYTTAEFIRRKFTADPSYSNDAVNNFYELRDKTTKANTSYKNKGVLSNDVDLMAEKQFNLYYKSISSMWKSIDYIGSLENESLPDGFKERYKDLINKSRFADSTKEKVIDDLKDNKLNKESVTMLQKTVRDEIIKLADKAVKEYKETHTENNKKIRE